jgi:DnaJ like chaperone protein
MLCCVRKAEENRDIWQKLSGFLGSFSNRTGVVGQLANILDPDTWLPGGRDAAKMAVADGAVTASEVRAFNATVEVTKGQEPQVERLFNLAKQDVAGYDAYARKVARFFANTPDTLEHVLDSLFFIATADGLVHEAELDYLRSVSMIFGFDEARFEQIAAQHVMLDEGADPYTILGLSHQAPPEEVRRVYRLLVAEHHPDRLIAKGVPEELIDVATARMAAINLAYQAITKPRPQPLLA